ncbi:MAG: NPCBM/NEW2 domain-containing protein [Limisphaerales bacterium]
MGRPIAGILGYDCLRHYCVQLDFTALKMRFLDGEHADKQAWGTAFPIVPLNSEDGRPAVAENLLGARGPHSLIDSGYDTDGWLMPKYFQFWSNTAVPPGSDQARSPDGLFGGQKYPLISLNANDVESDGIGLRFLARHLVTLDFPRHTMYLQRRSVGPLPNPKYITTRMETLDMLTRCLIERDPAAVSNELLKIERGSASEEEKTVARKLAATLEKPSQLAPADVPSGITSLPLGDARPDSAVVGWLEPAANRIPLNGEIVPPFLDSGKIYATGLFAHSPSRYVYNLGGKWKKLRGEAGLHTAFQHHAYGVIFVIKTDGKEVFRSGVIDGAEHARYEVDVAGVRSLELVVEKAHEQNGGNWGLWLEPTLLRP